MEILIINDYQGTRADIKQVLVQNGFTITEAINGREGFSKFMETEPNLVIIDVNIAKIDGYTTIEVIRNYQKNQTVPIIILARSDDVNSIEQALEKGVNDFITKPINFSLLTQRIKYAIKTVETENKLLNKQAQLNFSQKLFKLGYWEWDINNDQVSGSKSVFGMFSVPYHANISMEQLTINILPEDLSVLQKAISEVSLKISKDIQISFRVNHHDGEIKHIYLLAKVILDSSSNPYKIIGSAQDISRLNKAESLINYQTNHDNLTELPNRSFFNETLEDFLTNLPTNKLSAIVILDIDRFKKINDNLGQKNGDLLLFAIANKLKRVTREKDLVARLGSDEFAILIKNTKNTQELNLSIIRIFNELTSGYHITEQELFITFSMGISVIALDGKIASDLIAHANIARSKAKQQGGDKFLFYQSSMNRESKKELMLENNLRKALENNEIEIYYQPQVYADSLKLYGAEALVRWNHPTKGVISPEVFIPLAESTELIMNIGLYVLESAVKEAEKWHIQGYTDLHIGINLSSRQFSNTNLIKNLQTILANSSLPAKYIDLEITESLAMNDAEQSISILKSLKALGVSISIDDFGTGYSSLAYLHRFPIDTIKIDRSFIQNLETTEGQALVKTILAMANSLNLKVIAEGIEKDIHLKILQQKKCDILQGYKLGKPMNSEEFQYYLKT